MTCNLVVEGILWVFATLYNALQHVATHRSWGHHGGMGGGRPLQHYTTQCNKLSHTATHCNTSLYTHTLGAIEGARVAEDLYNTATHCNKLHHAATHCQKLQHTHVRGVIEGAQEVGDLYTTATHCNTLQQTTPRCNTLQHAATRCNTLQHAATHTNPGGHRESRGGGKQPSENHRGRHTSGVAPVLLQRVAMY